MVGIIELFIILPVIFMIVAMIIGALLALGSLIVGAGAGTKKVYDATKANKVEPVETIGDTVRQIQQAHPDVCCRPNSDYSQLCIDAKNHSGNCF